MKSSYFIFPFHNIYKNIKIFFTTKTLFLSVSLILYNYSYISKLRYLE